MSERMETLSTVKGTVFAKEDGVAFINLARQKQIVIPAKGIRVGDTVTVTVQRVERAVERLTKWNAGYKGPTPSIAELVIWGQDSDWRKL